MTILCTICARGGSTNLKDKNILELNGYPLIYYTINVAINSGIFDDIFISSDSKKIINIAKKFGIENYILRSKKLSTKYSNKLDVIKDTLVKAENITKIKYSYICDLDVTSPLRTIKDIKNCYKMIKTNKFSNIFSVTESRKNPYFNIVENKNKTFKPVSSLKKYVSSRQLAPKVYDMNASIYMWKRKSLLLSKSVFNKKSSIYLMKNISIDIDDKNDFNYINYIIKNKKLWKF